MNISGKVVTSTIAVVAVVNLVYFFSLTNSVSITGLFFTILIIFFSWDFGRKYDTTIKLYDSIKVVNEKLQKEKLELTIKYEDYEQFFTSFDEAIFFSYNYNNHQAMFSKGIEKLIGYTQTEFNNNKDILKQIVHNEDFLEFNKALRELKHGKPVRKELKIIHPKIGEKWVLFKAQPFRNMDGMLEKINGQFEDITRQKELELELQRMAFFDELTDIPNRKMLDRQIQKALVRSKRHQHNFSIMFIDLDDFKKVNDTLGHDAGDQLLIDVVSRINQCIREEDLISRIGGDEFIVMFEETGKDEIEQIAERIIKYVAEPYKINDYSANISLSIGISMYPNDGEDKEKLIKAADKAMYYAKNNGKNNYQIYTEDLNDVEINDKGIFNKWMEVL
ncbi:sensor domain-containing diguanylate cyclase [Lysinibacillus sp. SGAir0095]|uniref:sensor domain-containing diguanylate cyclase n=1 Tax=Lysinibacillus sp. SGAir0095 TaxID=2070463 RepID=UPI0010CCF298|nr:sensor domain-containing diguanylate cyclase [Lysinibacillus sp. SGAir0095]QCR31210.1 sensor domain-containing diguanylate cyclase [Lysinibacillus sp. SGAir0095]